MSCCVVLKGMDVMSSVPKGSECHAECSRRECIETWLHLAMNKLFSICFLTKATRTDSCGFFYCKCMSCCVVLKGMDVIYVERFFLYIIEKN